MIAEGVVPSRPDAPEAPAAPDAPETPAATEPTPIEPTEPAPTAPDQGQTAPDDDNSWLLPLLIIAGLILVAVVVGGLIARSKKSDAPPASPTPSSPSPTPESSLLSTSTWITDQLSLELLAAPPAAAQQRWTVERSRLDNVAIGAQQQYLDAKDANWQPLAQTMSALAASIDTNLALRAQDPPNTQLINESTDVVNRHRAAAQQLVAVLLPTIDR